MRARGAQRTLKRRSAAGSLAQSRERDVGGSYKVQQPRQRCRQTSPLLTVVQVAMLPVVRILPFPCVISVR